MKITVEGCCHGALDKIYESIPKLTELLIICGDFQALRNQADLDTISMPQKYRHMGDFHRYYRGEKKAPVPTLFIGGNHECLLYMAELKYGGWVAENIYFLGAAGAVWFGGLRISGLSGVWVQRLFVDSIANTKTEEYLLPYDRFTIKLAYHIKAKQYIKFYLIGKADISLSHDWPRDVWENGKKAFSRKPWLEESRQKGQLGNPLAAKVLLDHKPQYWFSLHLHMDYKATVSHKQENEDEISLDMDMEEGGEEKPQQTQFLALNKCLPGRKFIETLDVESSGDMEFSYDARSVAVNKVVDEFFAENPRFLSRFSLQQVLDLQLGDLLDQLLQKVEAEMEFVKTRDLKIPRNFKVVAPVESTDLKYWENNQTVEFRERFWGKRRRDS